MTTKEVKELIEFHENIYGNLCEYVESYVEWVKNNIPQEFWNYFGVEYYYDNSVVGTMLGFVADNGETYPLNWDKFYYAMGNFNYPVNITPRKVTKDYAQSIPVLIEKGIYKVREFSSEMKVILNNKIDI